MPDYHVPSVIALALWAACAVYVAGYTLKAYGETA